MSRPRLHDLQRGRSNRLIRAALLVKTDEIMSRRVAAVSGIAWSMISQAFRMGLQLASTVILARLLTPADFGLFAMLMPVAALASLIQDLGLSQAIIQKENLSKAQTDLLYWINFGIAVAVALLLVVLSPLAVAFYNEPQVGPMLAAWSIHLLMGAVSFGQYAMLARALQFRSIALIDMASGLAAFVTAVAIGVVWPSPWALWWSSFAASATWSGLTFVASSWRPGLPRRHVKLEGMFQFGFYVFINNVALFTSRNLDNVLIGRNLGGVALGYYDRAYKLLLYPFENLGNPISRVMIPLLSRLQSDDAGFRRAYKQAGGAVSLLCVPLISTSMACAPELIGLILGEKWLPVSDIFVWLGFGGLVLPVLHSTGWIFLAQGRSQELMTLNLFSSVLTAAAFFVGLQWGLAGVAIAYASVECLVRAPLACFIAGRRGAVTHLDILGVSTPALLGAALTMALRPVITLGSASTFLTVLVSSYILTIAAFAIFAPGREVLMGTLRAGMDLKETLSKRWPFSRATN